MKQAPQAAVSAPLKTEAETGTILPWALAGGSLLLLGLGGAAFMRSRRRSTEDAQAVAADPIESAVAIEPEPVRVAPPPTAPAIAASTMPTPATLEAMVAAPPNAENPFRTHKKRVTRAKFLLAQREDQTARTPAAMPEPVAAVTRAPADAGPQTQTVYRLGANRGLRPGFKPQTR